MVRLTWLEWISNVPFSFCRGLAWELLVELVKEVLEPTLEILCLCTNSLAGKSVLEEAKITVR